MKYVLCILFLLILGCEGHNMEEEFLPPVYPDTTGCKVWVDYYGSLSGDLCIVLYHMDGPFWLDWPDGVDRGIIYDIEFGAYDPTEPKMIFTPLDPGEYGVRAWLDMDGNRRENTGEPQDSQGPFTIQPAGTFGCWMPANLELVE